MYRWVVFQKFRYESLVRTLIMSENRFNILKYAQIHA